MWVDWLLAGKGPRADLFRVGGHGAIDLVAEFGVALRVARQELPEAEQIVEDLDLAVTAHSCADSDRGDGHECADARGELCGNALEHDREGARGIKRDGIGDDLGRGRRDACPESGSRRGR